jgi:hypothetical protein
VQGETGLPRLWARAALAHAATPSGCCAPHPDPGSVCGTNTPKASPCPCPGDITASASTTSQAPTDMSPFVVSSTPELEALPVYRPVSPYACGTHRGAEQYIAASVQD